MKAEMENTGKSEGMPHERTPMSFKIECLKKQGYDKQFGFNNDEFIYLETGEVLQPGDITIIEHQRFEGISDPDDMAILYVIETKSGIKGTVIATYGTYGDADLISFMNQAKDLTKDNLYNECVCEN